jgi:acyl-CoA synthetase (AMP-forming)/AMP-acid ligase II
MGQYDYGFYQVIKRNARVMGDRVALISGDKRISYGEFLEKVDSVACGLSGVGLMRGDRIAVLALNNLEYIYLYGAAAKIGAIVVPINWRLSSEEVEYVMSDASPKIIFVDSDFQPMVRPILAKLHFVEKCYAIGRAEGDFTAFNNLLGHNENYPTTDVKFSDPYVIIYTAAVHGKLRGATLTHQNIFLSNFQSMYFFDLTEKDVHIIMLPLFHLAALSLALGVMQAGGLNVILPKFDVDQAVYHIQRDKVTIFCEFPPMLSKIMDRAKGDSYDLSSVRNVLGLDDPETIKRFENLTGAICWIGYGQTETSIPVSLSPYFKRPGSAGKLTFIAEVEIMNAYGDILETGASGEIVARGPTVFDGYWNLPKDNEYTFRNGWLHTGDIGRLDEDGYLWYEGRKADKELIKPGGENVYPAEVEKIILEHPMVEEVSVIGVPDEKWGEAIKAVCVLKKGVTLHESELVEFVATRIARFKKPKYVIFVSTLPKTEDGLIDREKVKAKYSIY